MARRLQLFCALLLALAVLAAPATPTSAPMYTDLGTVEKAASIIVIGKVRDDRVGLVVEVERSIRGGIKPGPLPVLESPDGHVIVKPERLVAFVDRQRALRWVGQLLAGPSLEKGVLRIEGFYDFDAHIVTPGVMTLGQLEHYLRSGRLTQTFHVRLVFPDGQGGLASSPHSLKVVYNAITHQATWSGLQLACFPKTASLLSVDYGSFELELASACPKGSSVARRLRLKGKFTGANLNTGMLLVEAFPERPFMTETEFQRFAQDDSIVDVQRKVQIELSDGTKYVWHLGSRLVSPSGRQHPAGAVAMGARSRVTSAGVQSSSHVTYRFGKIELTLTPGTGTVSPGGSPATIVQWIEGSGPKSCRMIGPGKRNRTCTLTQLPPEFVTIPPAAPAAPAAGGP